MTQLQVSVLFSCAQANGLDWHSAQFRRRQIEWLLKRRMIRKFRGNYVATKGGKRILHHQIEDWSTVPQAAKDALLDGGA